MLVIALFAKSLEDDKEGHEYNCQDGCPRYGLVNKGDTKR